jgi:cyclopropane fatty-acyl-phospholipid synthase-like methyltransferase
MDSSEYQKAWDQQYFKDYFLTKERHLWDVDAKASARLDEEVMSSHMDRRLPLLDLGCGVGHQSAYFASVYAKVIGVDVSKRAIQLAKSNYILENVEFREADLTVEGTADVLVKDFGHCNVYMRGVLHQIKSEDEEIFCNEVSSLIGEEGRMYFNEVSDGIREYLEENSSRFSKLPEKMRQVFLTKMPPKGVSEERIQRLFGESFMVYWLKESYLATRLTFEDGSAIKIPSWSCVFGRKV